MQMIKGYTDFSLDMWIDQRTYVSFLEIKHSSQQPEATDIQKAFLTSFPEGLEMSKAEFLDKLSKVETPSLESLGPVLNLTDYPDGSTMAVYHVNLASAHASIKVSVSCRWILLCPCILFVDSYLCKTFIA